MHIIRNVTNGSKKPIGVTFPEHRTKANESKFKQFYINTDMRKIFTTETHVMKHILQTKLDEEFYSLCINALKNEVTRNSKIFIYLATALSLYRSFSEYSD